MSGSKQSPVAKALREAGFVPLPRLWVKAEDMRTIHFIAEQYEEEVNKVRRSVDQEHELLVQQRKATAQARDKLEQAKEDKDLAWELYQKTQK